MIAQLEVLKEKHGDVECWHDDYSIGCISTADSPEYREVVCHDTKYSREDIPDCHPNYKGIFIGGDY